jgi:hypothetical protein
MGVPAFIRARDGLLAANTSEASVESVCEEILYALHEVAVFDRSAIMTTDPDTLLPSGGVVEGYDAADCVPFWDNELLDPDFNKYTQLARSHDPVATLVDAVDGDLEQSPRYQRSMLDSASATSCEWYSWQVAPVWQLEAWRVPQTLVPSAPRRPPTSDS